MAEKAISDSLSIEQARVLFADKVLATKEQNAIANVIKRLESPSEAVLKPGGAVKILERQQQREI